MTYDAIVLGLGGMGSAAAAALARRGQRVLGFDRFPRGHVQGSSHGHTRIIRTAYFEHADYVPLCLAAFGYWYDLEQRTGRHLLTGCHCLSLGRADGELIRGVSTAAHDHALTVERLEPERLRKRYPQFQFDDDYLGVCEQAAGFLYVDDCVRALQDDAIAHRADLRFGEQVLEWKAVGDGVAVRTPWETHSAKRLAIAAGPWAKAAIADARLPLTVMRQVPMWFRPDDPSLFRRDRFPLFIAEVPAGHFYGVPMIDYRGVKTAMHYGAPEVAGPEKLRFDVTPEDEAPVRSFLNEHIPDAAGKRETGSVCLYTLTPDRHFILDRHPEHSQVAVAVGFSGHGFKFAPVVGEILADLLTVGQTRHPIGMFSMKRFNRPN
jgi:sarcosine oxidase